MAAAFQTGRKPLTAISQAYDNARAALLFGLSDRSHTITRFPLKGPRAAFARFWGSSTMKLRANSEIYAVVSTMHQACPMAYTNRALTEQYLHFIHKSCLYTKRRKRISDQV